MQRNGAAPVFCFFLCFWGSVCGLTELIHNPCSASTRCPVDLVRRHVIQRLVSSLRVVKHKVVRQSPLSFRHRGVPSQIDVFVLDAPPEPLHKDVVQGPPAPIHADGDAVRLEHPGERL